MTKETFPVVCPVPVKEDHKGRGNFFHFTCFYATKLRAFYFCCLILLLPVLSFGQNGPILTKRMVAQIKQNAPSIIEVKKQKIPYKEKFVLRFPELGAIYNPDFPNTRNQVFCRNYHNSSDQFVYIGKSVSTHRSTIMIANKLGNFTSVWQHDNCTSLIEYKVTRNGDYLEITGKVYSCLVDS